MPISFRHTLSITQIDICILGKVPAAQMLPVFTQFMERLKLPVSMQKTRCLRCPDEDLEFLGYRIGMNYRHTGKGVYIGTRPSMLSIQSICRKVSEQNARRYGLLDSQEMVKRLNWMLSGWGNYFHLGQVSPAYRAVDALSILFSCRKQHRILFYVQIRSYLLFR